MTRFLLLLTFLAGPYIASAQNISFNFQGMGTPAPNAVWTDTSLQIEVVVDAPSAVTTVQAAVDGRQVALVTSGGNIYRGRLSLDGLAGDTLALTVSAEDSQNNAGDTAIPFIYRPLNDPGVTLTVDSLVDSSVVRSSYPLNAQSPGNTIAVYRAQFNNDQLLVTAQGSVPVIDLARFNGDKVTIKVVATDSQGRTARRELTAFVENSPYITEYLTVNGKMLDFAYNKALVAQKGTGYPVLVDAATGQASAPLINVPILQTNAYVTPQGAIFSDAQGVVYEWKNGQIVYQSLCTGNNLKVSGNYAAWKREANVLMRRNLVTGVTDSVAAPGISNSMLDVAPRGVVFFTANTSTRSSVTKYDSGTVSTIPPPPGGRSGIDALTDGYNAIFVAPPLGIGNNSLYFYNGQNNSSLLLFDTAQGLRPSFTYQVNNKYSAYVRSGHVIVRDTLGTSRQIASFNGCSSGCILAIDKLNSKGALMVSSTNGTANGRYLIEGAGVPRRITAMQLEASSYPNEILSRSFYDGANWYILIGKTLFRVDIDSIPANGISDIAKPMNADSILRFTRNDFTSHFSGPGELYQVKITTLPKNGALKVQGVPVASNAISLSNLDQLTYEPDSGYTGADTIRWTASNGIEFIADTASILINVIDSTGPVTPIPQPAISGLYSNYCNAADNQVIKIANLPAAGSGIEVTVVLDSTTALTVGADSSFSINPSALSAGKHYLNITFASDTAQKTLALSFNITPAVTPALDVTVNVNPITTDSVPVVLTATNVTGGGKQPLFTFARDAQFTNQLQIEGANSAITVAASVFNIGANKIYVRVRTSEQCYNAQTGIDSITVNKTNITAIVDVDNPNNPVIVYPNPFRDQISVNGLLPVKTYIISLYDIGGRLLVNQRVVNQTKAEIVPPANGGIYILRVYDEKAKKLLGAQKLIKY